MRLRNFLERTIDAFQFSLATFPALPGQSRSWLKLGNMHYNLESQARWAAIESVLHATNVDSALDIGCHAGYFCLSLALYGIPALGIDQDDRALRLARHAAQRMKSPKVGFGQMTLTPDTVRLLPQVDMILMLSTWPHWVSQQGLGGTSEMLSTVWNKCQKVMFFEIGDVDRPPDFGLAFGKLSPRHWQEDYLSAICADAQISWMGTFKAVAPQSRSAHTVVNRNLFQMSRQKDEVASLFERARATQPATASLLH